MKHKSPKQSISISAGYLRLAQILLFCGILLTGVFMVSTAITQYKNSVKQSLVQNCEALVANINEVYGNKYWIPNENIDRLVLTAESKNNYQIFMYSAEGRMLYPVSDDNSRMLEASTRHYLRTEDYLRLGYYTEERTGQQLCYAYRFFLEADDGTMDEYYLAAVVDAENIVEYSQMLTLSLVVCLLVSTLLFMFLFRIGASRVDRQFEQINSVTQKYAEGEFDARVELPEHSNLYPFAQTLNRMAEFIEQNETTRKNFVANVSHELRTPMTTIGGFASGIIDGTIPPEQHDKYLRIIAEEIQRLRTLITSMLNLTKFEAGEMSLRYTELDVGKLLVKTVLMFEKRINDKKVDVEGLESTSLQLTADEDLLFQVLYNLIENAVKFVNEGGVISFSVRTEQNMACICVKNTGEGLADDELSKVFDRFYKTDESRSKDKTGLGLGLSLARKIINLHQGQIVVKSVQGEYTAFEVQLPISGQPG